MPAPLRLAADAPSKALPRKFRFTVAALAAVRVPEGKDRVWVFDSATANLGMMKTAAGSTAFYFVGKLHGRKVRARLGSDEISIDTARRLAAAHKATVVRGVDPGEAKRVVSHASTLDDVWKRFVEQHGRVNTRVGTQRIDAAIYKTHLATPWGNRKPLTLTAAEIQDRHAKITAARGPVAANRAVSLLRRLMNWAQIPCPINRYSVRLNREHSRTRFMSAAEVQRLFVQLDAEKTYLADFVRLALFTGARRANLLSIEWREIDFDAATWTIPADKSKNGTPMHLHLPAAAVLMLKRRACGTASRYVFPSKSKTGHINEPKKGWAALRERAEISDLHLHDLRRTLGSWMAATGGSLPIIGKALGHASADSTAIYARLQLDPVRAAVDAATFAMAAAGADTPSKP